MRASVQSLPWSIDPSLLLASIPLAFHTMKMCATSVVTAEVVNDGIDENNVPSALLVLNRNLTHVGSTSY
jgi:hypothetical protein